MLVEVAADLGCLSTIDVGGQDVARELDGILDGVGVGVGGVECSLRDEVERTTGAKVVDNGGVKLDADGLAGGDGLERIGSKVRGLETEADAVEGNLLLCSNGLERSTGYGRTQKVFRR